MLELNGKNFYIKQGDLTVSKGTLDVTKDIKSNTKVNELLIFFSIIAGLSTFGFWGMILGPAITTLFISSLKLLHIR